MTDYYVDEDYEDAFDDQDDAGYYVDEDLADDIDDLRPAEFEGRTSWMYLGLLCGLFVLLVFFSWACNDRSDPPGETQTEEQAAVTTGSPVRLSIEIDGDVVTLRGAVPDDAAHGQVLSATQALYGPENVIDELTIDENFTLDGGALSVTGTADFDDDRPEQLRDAVAAGFGLGEREFTIDRGQGSVEAVALQGTLADGTLTLTGAVPDRQSVAELTAAVESVYGTGSADVGGVTVADSSWTDAVLVVTGTALPSDQRHEDLAAAIQQRFGPSVVVDVSAVSTDVGPAALRAIEDELGEQVLEDPIQFAPLSAEIVPESEAILLVVAETLNSIPETEVEVVGHTDDAGPDAANQALSLERAEAVIARLGELGVDTSRLSARGEGESLPLVPNDSDENRARNRRIEFRLVGAE